VVERFCFKQPKIFRKKIKNFECGIESIGNARIPFSVKYSSCYFICTFDVEVIFFLSMGNKELMEGWSKWFYVFILVGFSTS
jgi:NADH-quinone oxidoreductase subunit A